MAWHMNSLCPRPSLGCCSTRQVYCQRLLLFHLLYTNRYMQSWKRFLVVFPFFLLPDSGTKNPTLLASSNWPNEGSHPLNAVDGDPVTWFGPANGNINQWLLVSFLWMFIFVCYALKFSVVNTFLPLSD